MEFQATLTNLSEMLIFIAAEAKKADFKEQEMNFIELACEEAIVNVIHHGYKEEGDHTIVINVEKSPKGIQIIIQDGGILFDPTLVEMQVDLTQPAEQRKVGGLGIYLMKQLTDHLEYRRIGEKNQICLTFFLNSQKRKS